MDNRQNMLDIIKKVTGYADASFITDSLFEAGYRLDPYPNGKSKGELVKRIEELEAERDRARNLLHQSVIALTIMDKTVGQGLKSLINTFLAETSTVKS